MEPFYLVIVLFLFLLAIFDLVVGVSNDAANFLNSAIGSKSASFRVIMIIAAVGILVGATLSNGMMDIARHGIYQPQHFYFDEIMFILLAVMLTDVVLLDLFNSLGMPTSTTVSLVFELLGGTFGLSLMKVIKSDGALTLGQLINTDKALSVIIAIFVSVAIAFFFGTLVQYISRIIFTFNYKAKAKYFIGLFGGIAATAIVYFMLIKGLKESSFMTTGFAEFIYKDTSKVVIGCLIGFTILMQILYWCRISVFKTIVLMGTFALALAFAGNDLVNFIGVPLAGYSSYIDFISQSGNVSTDTFLMTSLQGSAQTPWYFLVGAGIVMVIALFTSKKAQCVVQTQLDLSRQEEGEEAFGTSPMARMIVRTTTGTSSNIASAIPVKVRQWLDSRFNKDEMILEKGASFDLVRAAVNVVLAGLLIAMGTSLKLPLSTTYVTFMVAMGSSLADRAWGRESAVYRITGVLSVIGGWFLTAGAAFFICFFVTLLIYFGKSVAIVALIALAVFILLRSHLLYKNKINKNKKNPIVEQIMSAHEPETALALLREHTRNEIYSILDFTEQNYEMSVNAFINENFRTLRKVVNRIDDEKRYLKQMKRIGTLATSRLDPNVAIEKGVYYYQGNDFVSEIIYSLGRLTDPCLEHLDNNFNPLEEDQKKGLERISREITGFLHHSKDVIKQNTYDNFEEFIYQSNTIINQLSMLKRAELKRIQTQTSSIKVGMVYLSMMQEAQNVMSFTINLLKVSRKFQQ